MKKDYKTIRQAFVEEDIEVLKGIFGQLPKDTLMLLAKTFLDGYNDGRCDGYNAYSEMLEKQLKDFKCKEE